MAKREKVTVDEIVGIVKTEEVTDSVEEVRKLRGRENMTGKRSMEHCLNYTGKPKCHYTGEICDDDFVQICEDYRSDEGTYPCPHCNRTGLKLLDYGSDKVWECLRCGAELWYCKTVEEMKKRCREIKGDVE